MQGQDIGEKLITILSLLSSPSPSGYGGDRRLIEPPVEEGMRDEGKDERMR